jgi:conjugative transfer signal peptidase TraF
VNRHAFKPALARTRREHCRHVLTRLAVAAMIVAGAFLANTLGGRFILFNASPSAALGFYVASSEEPGVGQLVEFELPAEVRNAFPYVSVCDGNSVRILKPIAAGPGDHLDTVGDWLCINGRRIAPIFTTDSNGHPLPVWRANRRLGDGEFFVFSSRVPNSFDSRYYGPIRRGDIIAVRRPLWTWNDGAESIADLLEASHANGNPGSRVFVGMMFLMESMQEF